MGYKMVKEEVHVYQWQLYVLTEDSSCILSKPNSHKTVFFNFIAFSDCKVSEYKNA